jgi:hypothetical protein
MRKICQVICREVQPRHLKLSASSLHGQEFSGMASRRPTNVGDWKSSKCKVFPEGTTVDGRYWGGIISLADAQDGQEKKAYKRL